jgi:MFS family permease
LIDAVLCVWFLLMLLRMSPHPVPHREPITLRTLLGGVEFVWRTKIILGALSLDMFAVLLGGATALLPFYADIMKLGPDGLGWLRSAPGVGALCISFILAHMPPMRRAGPTLLWCVAGFGAATIVFGLSRNFWLAWSMLFLTGMLDMISVIIRHTLVQTSTPDSMRGRVSAVNSVFISVSNELGAFESGLVAQWFVRPHDPAFGPMVSVVSGGVGTILVVLATAILVPSVRRYGKLGEKGE